MRFVQTVGRKEAVRKRIVSLVFLIYFLLIFEGAFRKWVIPEFHQIIFFLRDPFVLVVYWYALANHFFQKASIPISAVICLAMLGFVFVIIPVAAEGVSPFVGLYGWRNYFFYIPLAFVIGECFEQIDLFRLFRVSLLIAIPMAVLAYVQFQSPPDSFINKAISEDIYIFRVSEDIVRTTGTFTFTTGYSYFVGSIVSILTVVLMLPSNVRPVGGKLLWFAAASAATMIALGGSRTVFFFAILSLLGAVAAGLLIPGSGFKRAIVIPVLLFIFGMAVFVFVFPVAFEAMAMRQESASLIEGNVIVRALLSFVNFYDVVFDAPILGYGIGLGTGGGSLLATGISQFTLAEDEWSRIILEIGPLFGFAFIIFRVIFVIYLANHAIKSAIQGDRIALILFAFIGIPLANGAITMQGTVNGYAWLFCGLCLAAIKRANGGLPIVRGLRRF